MPAPPSVTSFLLADQVFRQESGKWCLIGVFNRILAPCFPVTHHSLGIFIVLADAKGDYDLKLEFRDGDDRVLSVFEGIRVSVPDPLRTVEVGIQAMNLALKTPGRYFFKLWANGELVKDLPVDAVLATPPPAR